MLRCVSETVSIAVGPIDVLDVSSSNFPPKIYEFLWLEQVRRVCELQDVH
jgi:hypothetical protein